MEELDSHMQKKEEQEKEEVKKNRRKRKRRSRTIDAGLMQFTKPNSKLIKGWPKCRIQN
jgi:recombinational DNA repair ATPase RecF